VLEVEVSHDIPDYFKKYEGMVIDFGLLKKVVEDTFLSEADHKYLNDVYGFDADTPPTAENTVGVVVAILEPIFGAGLVRVRMYETPNSFAEWKKEA
jgi:6-pyruvoyl-tetrahydropterin synthase